MLEIRDLFIFEGLTDTEKDEMISLLDETVLFEKGSVIYSADKFQNAIGFVISGKAFAVSNNDGGLYMNSFNTGDCFGVAAIFGGTEQYVSTIIAKTKTQILFIDEKHLKKMFENQKIVLNYIKFLSTKIRFLNNKLNLLSCENAESKVYNYLYSVCDSEGFAVIPKSMTLLSKMLGLGRATLYRSLDNLEKNNMILRENNNIKVIKNEKNS